MHTLVINEEILTDLVWATCSCGWIGEEWEDQDDALLDWEAHRDEEQ